MATSSPRNQSLLLATTNNIDDVQDASSLVSKSWSTISGFSNLQASPHRGTPIILDRGGDDQEILEVLGALPLHAQQQQRPALPAAAAATRGKNNSNATPAAAVSAATASSRTSRRNKHRMPRRISRQGSENAGISRHQVELASAAQAAGGASWAQRIRWMRTRGAQRRNGEEHVAATSNNLQLEESSATNYHGGAMDADGGHVYYNHNAAAAATHAQHHDNNNNMPIPNKMQQPPALAVNPRIQTFLTHSSDDDDDDNNDDDDEASTVLDFKETDWTPPDSSYGAAIPVAGFIPKSTRRTIEWTLIGSLLVFLAYLIVATSIRIGDENYDASSKGVDDYGGYDSGGVGALNDDYYIEYNSNNNNNNAADDDAVAAEEDEDDNEQGEEEEDDEDSRDDEGDEDEEEDWNDDYVRF